MKNLKKIVAAVLVSVMAFSLAGCSFGKVTAVSMKDFKKAVKAVGDDDVEDSYYEIDEDEIEDWYRSYEKDDIIGVAGATDYDDLGFDYYQFEDADAAADYFEDLYDDFQDVKDDDDFDGKYKCSLGKSQGFIIFDGELDDTDFGDDFMIGGIYWADDMIITCYCTSDKKKDVEKYNAFIDALGYPSI